jgi:P4 family phage/plasmid primase-like protien
MQPIKTNTYLNSLQDMDNVKEQLIKYKTNNNYTHTSMSSGKYYISDENIDDLYKILSKYNNYDITEKHLDDKSPLIFDFDFKLKDINRQITNIHISSIINLINEYIDDIFCNGNKLCFIMQRDNPYVSNNDIKDGLHIIYPYIVTEYKYIYAFRDVLLIGLRWLENISINKIDDIIDKRVIQVNNWLLYGANKPNINASPYKIINIYNNDGNQENITKYTKLELLKLLSIRDNTRQIIKNNFILDDVLIDDTNNNEYKNIQLEYTTGDKYKIKYMLMNILNSERADKYTNWINIGLCLHNLNENYLDLWIEFSKRSKKYKKGECEKLWLTFKSNTNGLKIGSLYYYSKMDNKDKIKDLSVINTLENIKNNFPNNQLAVQRILRDNNYILIDLLDKYCPIFGKDHETNLNFIEMSPKGGIIMKCRCNKCIGKIYPNDHELIINVNDQKSLFNITINNYNNYNISNENKEDDEIKFDNIKLHDDSNLNELLLESLRYSNGNVYDIANILFYLFKNEFRYDAYNKVWYYYNGLWIKNNTKLKTKISNEIYYLYKTIRFNINKTNIQLSNRIKSLLPKLKESHFKSNIMTEAIEIFSDYCNNFDELLDNNKYLLGFNNGIYDFQNMVFRKSKPDDYISMSVGYDFFDKTNNNYDNNKENKLIKFFDDIQPDKQQLEYLLTYLSTCLVGVNLIQSFIILLGNGRNGKSKLNDLLSATLGNYYSSIKCKLLTKPQPDANTPDPMILDLRKVRLVIGSEPEKKDKLNTGYIKMLTGADKIKSRKCFSNDMIEFSVHFKTILLCNDVPELDDPYDEAYWMRCKCIQFPTKFVENPQELYEKKINYDLNIEELNIYFMLVLIEYYKKYKKNGIKVIESVHQITDNLKISNNLCLEFMINNTEVAETNIHTSYLYNIFVNWFKKNSPNEKIPSNKLFLKNIKSNYKIEDNIIAMQNGNKRKSTGIKNIKISNTSYENNNYTKYNIQENYDYNLDK